MASYENNSNDLEGIRSSTLQLTINENHWERLKVTSSYECLKELWKFLNSHIKREKILQEHGKKKQAGPKDGLGEDEDNGSLETASQLPKWTTPHS